MVRDILNSERPMQFREAQRTLAMLLVLIFGNDLRLEYAARYRAVLVADLTGGGLGATFARTAMVSGDVLDPGFWDALRTWNAQGLKIDQDRVRRSLCSARDKEYLLMDCQHRHRRLAAEIEVLAAWCSSRTREYFKYYAA